jgi:hypothetical protein
MELLLPIVNRCEVLESLSTFVRFDQTSLKNLLLSKPGLKSLFLTIFDPNLLETVKEFGGNLEVFQFTSVKKGIDLETLKNQLKGVFDEFGKREDKYGYSQIYTAKKAGAVANFKFD